MNTQVIKDPTTFEYSLEAVFRERDSISRAQHAAFEQYAAIRMPHRRLEDWKWSDFNAELRDKSPSLAPTAEALVDTFPLSELDPLEFRIVNGRIILPDEAPRDGIDFGVMDPVGTIPELEKHPLAILNVAMISKACGIQIQEGVDYQRPIVIRHINYGGGLTFAHGLMRISKGASATVIESFKGEGAALGSYLCHMSVCDNAHIRRYVISEEETDAVTHSILAAKIDKNARFDQTSLSTGSRLSRHETVLHYCDDDVRANIDSVALLADDRHADFTTNILHKAPGCITRQRHKGIATDKGRAVFQGKFAVERQAQKTFAQMSANALLLSDESEANHKPELEIYADDVECAHGSTSGALDEDALFYLRQRGLSEREARAILTMAFATEVLDDIEHDEISVMMEGRVNAWLGASI